MIEDETEEDAADFFMMVKTRINSKTSHIKPNTIQIIPTHLFKVKRRFYYKI